MSRTATRTPIARLVGGLIVVACLAAFSGCDGDAADGRAAAAPGSPENPLVAKPPSLEGTTSEQPGGTGAPGFEELVEQQKETRSARDRANPCSLVTKAQAEKILGGRLLDPVVAPQGPSCIYRNRSGRRFVTVAFQATAVDRLRRQVQRRQTVRIGDRAAFCGVHGQPVLYVPLTRQRVLSVAARCGVARQFASRAVPRLLG